MTRSIEFLAKTAMCALLAVLLCQTVAAQASGKSKKPAAAAQSIAGPKVTRIDIEGLKKLLKPGGKPLMINFWATWCDPCREEFPDLVKLDTAFRGKIDFITISLDDLAEINRDVPKFLLENKAEMPTYLLKTPDEDAAISLVTSEWNGNLPLTILFKENGETAYLKKGKIQVDAVTLEISKLLGEPKSAVSRIQIVDLPLSGFADRTHTFEQGVAAAQLDVSAKTYKLLRYGLTIAIPTEQLDKLKKKYAILVEESGCMISPGYDKYVAGYNSTTKAALQKKYGESILPEIEFAPTEVPVWIK